MRVIHFIPTAFNYFDYLQPLAFSLVEALERAGVKNDVLTLQYGKPSSRIVENIGAVASRSYQGTVPLAETFASLRTYDIVHIHCPLLGAAAKIIAWKKNYPRVPLATTYYGQIRRLDIIGLYIRGYNQYYLPQFFALSQAIVALRYESILRPYEKSGKIVRLDSGAVTATEIFHRAVESTLNMYRQWAE